MSPITDFFAFTNNMWPFSGRSTEPAADDTMARDQPTQQMEMGQPRALQPMDPQKPQDNIERAEPELNLRGGKDFDGHCRGRFCFIIPCPIPINCCVIPL